MIKINKIITFFFLLIILITLIIWKVLQNPFVANLLSNKITDLLEKEIDAKIEFSGVRFNIFPLGMEFDNARLLIAEGKDLSAKAEKIEIAFSAFDLFLNKITINKIGLYRGDLYLKMEEFKESENSNIVQMIEEIEQKDQRNILFRINDEINKIFPVKVRQIQISRVNLKLGEIGSTYVNFLDLFFKRNQKRVKILLENNDFVVARKKVILDEIKLDLDFNLDKNQFNISNFELKRYFTQLKLNGKLRINPLQIKKTVGESDVEISTPVVEILDFFNIQEYLPKTQKGFLTSKTKINFEDEKITYLPIIEIRDLECQYVKADEIKLKLKGEDQKIKIVEANLKNQSEEVHLIEETPYVDVMSSKLEIGPALFSFKEMNTKSILRILEGRLDPLDANCSGKAIIHVSNDKIMISSKDQIELSKINVDIKELKVLEKNNLGLKDFKATVDLTTADTIIEGTITGDDISISGRGLITKQGLDFEIKDSFANLSHFPTLMNMQMRGIGKIDFSVKGPYEDIHFNFDLNLKDAGLFGLNLGDIESNFTFSLKDLYLKFLTGKGIAGNNSEYLINGDISFENREVNLLIDLKKGEYKELVFIFDKFLRENPYLPKNVFGDFYGNFSIVGGITFESLKIDGIIRSKGEVNLFDEKIDSLSAQVKFNQKKIRFDNVKIKKDVGELNGFFEKDLSSEQFEIKGNVSNIPIEKFYLYEKSGPGLIGKIVGFFHLKKDLKNGLICESKLELIKSLISDEQVADSQIDINLSKDILSLRLNLVGGMILLNSTIDLVNSDNKKRSRGTFSVQSDDINYILSMISNHNLLEKSTKGGISFILNTEFNINKIEELNLDLLVDDFFFVRQNVELAIDKSTNFARIVNGRVINWGFSFAGAENSFKSNARGKLGENFRLDILSNLDSSIVELLGPKFLSVSGKIATDLSWIYSQNEKKLRGKVTSESLNLVYDDIPGGFEKCKLDLNIDDNKILINKIDGHFSNGKVVGSGSVMLKLPYPEVSLKGHLDDASMRLFKRSNIIFSGDIEVIGKERPYHINGSLTLNRGAIIDEFEEMSNKENSSGKKINVYLPAVSHLNQNPSWIILDIDVRDITNLSMKNSKAKIDFFGKLKISGSADNKKYDGNLTMNPGSGKIYFKNNDFILNSGEIKLISQSGSNQTHILFEGNSKISDYDILLKVNGFTDALTLELTSRPSLSKKNILSLLTLGYTEDVSKGLEAQDRQSLAQAGIGSIILDRLKLDEGLDSALGLNLVVAPELLEEGGVDINKQQSSKLRSATKIGIKKKINNKMDLSGNVTVGGQTRRQSMNLDYKLGTKVSLEGVYETTTGANSDKQQKQGDVSAGADLKFKWMFK